MLVVLSPIFVADTKITFVYNFVDPLKYIALNLNSLFRFSKKLRKPGSENIDNTSNLRD